MGIQPGQRLFRSRLQPGWLNYTPSFGGTTGINAGNATSVGRYQEAGETVFFDLKFTWGSTTVPGTGSAFVFGLPPVPRDTGIDTIFPALIIDISAATPGYRVAVGLSFTADDFFLLIDNGTAGIAIGPGNPWTWAAGDIIRVSGQYRRA